MSLILQGSWVLFGYDAHYPSGAMADFLSVHRTFNEALATTSNTRFDDYEILSNRTGYVYRLRADGRWSAHKVGQTFSDSVFCDSPADYDDLLPGYHGEDS